MSVPILGQPDANAPIDYEAFNLECAAGLELVFEMNMSQTQIACLTWAAQGMALRPDCGPTVRALLLDFVNFAAHQGDFGPETRKLLAQQAAASRAASFVQTSGQSPIQLTPDDPHHHEP
jgi:hypothetical protein